MSRQGLLPLTVLVAVAVAGGCAATDSPREREAHRVAEVVAQAISYPRQDDADGFVRAARAVRAAEDGRLTVVAKEGAAEHALGGRIARLTFRVHLAAVDSGWQQLPEIVRCYRVDFSRYGVMDGSPSLSDCPARTAWVEAAPAPLRRLTPVGSFEAVRKVLEDAPREASPASLQRTLRRALPAQPPGTLPPTVLVGRSGVEVGVAVHDDGGCLLAVRTAGSVLAWTLSPTQAQPGEVSCSAESALGRFGTRPPH
jgi:hypothetical protein